MTTNSEAELRAQIKDAADGLASTLESLVSEVQPSVQVEYLRQDVKRAASSLVEDAKESVRDMFERAKATLRAAVGGDAESIKKTAVVVGAAAATIVVLAIAKR